MRKKSMSEPQLSHEQQAMEKVWEEHLASEFKSKSAEAAINTMVERPFVNHVPVMTGGVGRKQLTHHYDRYFNPQMPPDTQITPVSRTIDHDRLVDEFVIKFTHTLQMDWLMPGVAPTNKPVEVATVVSWFSFRTARWPRSGFTGTRPRSWSS
jgi:carboxymethylenebutenolidase